MLKDIHLNIDGDIEIGFDGDLSLVYDDDALVERIRFRLQTVKGDYQLEPSCGASLEEFIGKPSTPLLGDMVRERVLESLTYDNFFSRSQLDVRVSPLGMSKLVIVVNIAGVRGNFMSAYTLDLLSGELSTD